MRSLVWYLIPNDVPSVNEKKKVNKIILPITNVRVSMELIALVEHCCNLCRREDIKAFVSKLVTNNNSTTHSNLQQSLKGFVDAVYGTGNWEKEKGMAT
jgi:hypothetical protein